MYLLCFAVLLTTITAEVIVSGIADMYAYNKIALNKTPAIADIAFFTKQHLRRESVRLFSGKLPSDSSVRSFHLYSSEASLAALNENLPDSGKKQYMQAHLKIDAPELTSQIKFRYRGEIPLHWLNEKKSLRIRLPDYVNYMGLQQFNLVNPTTLETLIDWLSYEMSREIGLLTPDYFPARVFINNQYNGLHFFLGQADESLLRKARRMPGNIYAGENHALENPFGENLGINSRVFIDHNSRSLMWADHRLWGRSAERNAESIGDRRDIQKFVSVINTEDHSEFQRQFAIYFDAEKYFLFWSLDSIVGSYHHDLYHNQKMYFDPYKGRFEPIQWDVRFWSVESQLPLTPLLEQVKLNPVLSHRLDQVTHALLSRFSTDEIIHRIEVADQVIGAELAADPYRQQPSNSHKFGNIHTTVPFFMDEYTDAIVKLKATYRARHRRVSARLNTSSAQYSIRRYDDQSLELTVAVTGNSAVAFNPWQLFPEGLHAQLQIYRVGVAGDTLVDYNSFDTLYSGKKRVFDNHGAAVDEWVNVAYGSTRLVSSPLHYRYRISGGHQMAQTMPNQLALANAVTGQSVSLSRVDKLPPDSETDSVHPWNLRTSKLAEAREINLSGTIDVNTDRVFSEDQLVTISPGTTFNLARGASMVFYGKVLANGTAANPITFRQQHPGENWGSVVVKGVKSSGSRFTHIVITGGSVTTQRLIDYPGELNIHEVENFELSHCHISSNQQGDDALHIAYSSGSISDCHFENTKFDAVDVDMSRVSITRTTFDDIGNDAIDLMASTLEISHIVVNNAGDKCLSIGEGSQARISHSTLSRCLIGVAVKDQSVASLGDVAFINNREVAIALYRKNPRYSSGGTIDGYRLYGISDQDVQIGEHSLSNISADEFFPQLNSRVQLELK